MNSEMITQALHEVEESDKALAAAFERRLDAIKVIAEYRREHGIPVPAEPDGGERAQELSAVLYELFSGCTVGIRKVSPSDNAGRARSVYGS